jgi:FHS family L-fucose permease-like MFS transporter
MIKKQSYLVPFILVTSLFFFWGFAHSILDVLNKHFQDALVISKSRSALVQAVVYGGYFLMALPAGSIIKKWGYRTGVVTGLILYGIGALLFIPGERIMSFEFFLLSLFIIGCGLTCLETAANPYITVLGDKNSGPQRLNLAQSFNGLGWICGPLIGGLLIFAGKSGNDGSVALPYAIIGIVVLIVAVVLVVSNCLKL